MIMDPTSLVRIITAAVTEALQNRSSLPMAHPLQEFNNENVVVVDSDDLDSRQVNRRHSLPSLFLQEKVMPKKRRGPILPKISSLKKKSVDIVCLPYTQEEIISIPRGLSRDQLAKRNLIGKITLWPNMSVDEVKNEIGSVFKGSFQDPTIFSFSYLDTMSGCKKLQRPIVSLSFKWGGSEVLSLCKNKCIYIMVSPDCIVYEQEFTNGEIEVLSNQQHDFDPLPSAQERCQIQLEQILDYPVPKLEDEEGLEQMVVEISTLNEAAEILLQHSQKVINENEDCHIYIRRKCLLQDAIQVFKSKHFSPTKMVRVNFLGEAGIDMGGLKKEFLDSLLHSLPSWQVFEGEEGKLTLTGNMCSLAMDLPYVAGIAVAVILCHGKMAVPLFSKNLIYYIASKSYHPTLDDISDKELKSALTSLQESKTVSVCLQDLAIEMDFFKDLSEHSEEFIKWSIRYICTVRNAANVKEFERGLRCLAVDDLIRSNLGHMLPLLCGEEFTQPQLDANTIYSLFDFTYSIDGSNQLAAEEEAVMQLVQFLSACCCSDGDRSQHSQNGEMGCCIRDFLHFVTGQKQLSVIGQERIKIQFTTEKYPKSNVCATTLWIPVHTNAEDFKEIFAFAILNSPDFGQV